MTATTVLELEGVTLNFSGVRSLDGVSLDIREGETFGIIGPNGAGKSSLFNCVSGVYRPQQGSIRHRGQEIRGARPDRINARGIGRTFQNVESFPTMTVLESVLLGRISKQRAGVLRGMLWYGWAAREEREGRAKAEEVLEMFGLGALRDTRMGELPGGTQRQVELCRALAAEPDVLLLDEPVAGMTHDEVESMVDAILDANERLGLTVVLIEHNMGVVMDICDRIAVLDFGRLVAVGTPAEIGANPEVLAAYLGSAQAESA
ncbi:ABC transporter ATP-binding protein [Actinomadura sp. KC216]|uniref:ABC transporter ATP-binding protein n=1 Tax=Actinomadura sp. KC216 TaxID=2530370 RepID=UPI001045BF22|nr:ABC transporter ATP-binding protein [Actinomadura sp. KC216]TDB86101.1 ABC transporter ATP-binding protein [Actinomadura sp. KC216]